MPDIRIPDGIMTRNEILLNFKRITTLFFSGNASWAQRWLAEKLDRKNDGFDLADLPPYEMDDAGMIIDDLLYRRRM